jgi:hypothetical protein
MQHLKIVLFAALMLSVGFAAAADKTVRITKVTGTVQLMKSGVVVMTIKPGDAIPANLAANMTFFVVSGSIEVEAGGMKISGVTGSEFRPTFSGGSLVVASEGRASVEVKNSAGQSVIMTSNSEIKMNTSGATTNVEVQKGRAVVTDASGGGTKMVNAGETASFPSGPVVVAQNNAPAPKEEPVTQDNPIDTAVYVPQTSVIVTQEATESSEVSGSTP